MMMKWMRMVVMLLTMVIKTKSDTTTVHRNKIDWPIAWPSTLDYGWPYHCQVQPCPKEKSSHPGFWQVPINAIYSQDTARPCVYVDACHPPTQDAALEYLWSNFLAVS